MALVGLEKICREAISTGDKIDLSDCHYGETTGCCNLINRPTSYYFFLAGLVRSQGLKHILEIGTNCGGSIMSMSKGLCQNATASNKLVTIDIMNKNDKGFKKYRHITRIKGDALDSAITKRVLSCFDNEIDLLFIDSLHEYEHTKKNIAIYAARLNPRYVILDDIRQCDEMRKLWHEIEEEFGENALDLSDVIMRSGAGFGIINWR